MGVTRTLLGGGGLWECTLIQKYMLSTFHVIYKLHLLLNTPAINSRIKDCLPLKTSSCIYYSTVDSLNYQRIHVKGSVSLLINMRHYSRLTVKLVVDCCGI